MNLPTYLHLVPYSLDANLADAYNRAVKSANPAVKWLLVTDADVMILTPQYGHLISTVIDRHAEAGLITCVTNRIGAQSQRAEEVPVQTADLREMRRAALARLTKYGSAVS